MITNQYQGQDTELSRSLVQDGRGLLDRRFVLKRFSSQTSGNQAMGVAPTKTFTLIEVQGKVRQMTGRDIISAGGLYQIGDLEVSCEMPVFGADNRGNTKGDTLIMDGQTFQLIGSPFALAMAGGVQEYQSVWRRQS